MQGDETNSNSNPPSDDAAADSAAAKPFADGAGVEPKDESAAKSGADRPPGDGVGVEPKVQAAPGSAADKPPADGDAGEKATEAAPSSKSDGPATGQPDDKPSGIAVAGEVAGKASAAGGDDMSGKTDIIRASDLMKAVAAQKGGAPEPEGARSLEELIADAGRLQPGEVILLAKQIVTELSLIWDESTFKDAVRPSSLVVWGDEAKRLVSLSPARAKKVDSSPTEEAQFVPPEKVKGGTPDGRGDIFGLGVILYKMLTGKYPFEGNDEEAVKQARVKGSPKRVNELEDDIPPELGEFVSGLLSVSPDLRYPNPAEVLRDIELLAKAAAEKLHLDLSDETDAMELDLMGQSALIGTPPAPGDGQATDVYSKPPSADHRATERLDGQRPPKTEEAKPADEKSGKEKPEQSQKKETKGAEPVPVIVRETVPARGSKGYLVGVLIGVPLLLLVGVLILTGGDIQSIAGPRPPKRDPDKMAALNAEAEEFHRLVVKMVDSGNLNGADRALRGIGSKYDLTDAAIKVASLRALIRNKKADTARAAEKRAKEAELLKTAAFEKKAREFRDSLSDSFDNKEYRKVVDAIDASRGKYAASKVAAEINGLKKKALAGIHDDTLRAAEARKAEERRSLLALAAEQLEKRELDQALDSVKRAEAAGAKQESTILRRRIGQVKLVIEAEQAEKDGDLKSAVELLVKALIISPDAEIEKSKARLESILQTDTVLALAKRLQNRGNWAGALAAYQKALPGATDAMKVEIEKAIAEVHTKAELQRLVAKAEGAFGTEKWQEAIEAASQVLKMMPEHENAAWIYKRSHMAIGPDKSMTNSIGMNLVLVPAGEFLMGSEEGDADEAPERKVFLDAYFIGVCEVTNAQYEAFDSECKAKRVAYSPNDETPVVLVNWEDATRFCQWLSEKEGIAYSLPSEAQFEKAARGTDAQTYPWGEDEPGVGSEWQCNIAPERKRDTWAADGYEFASPVGVFAAHRSPYGVRDLAGNAWEWCSDWYNSAYYSQGENSNPKGPESGKQRALRGGSFANDARAARSTNRTAKEPDYVEATVGFRVVRALDPIYVE